MTPYLTLNDMRRRLPTYLGNGSGIKWHCFSSPLRLHCTSFLPFLAWYPQHAQRGPALLLMSGMSALLFREDDHQAICFASLMPLPDMPVSCWIAGLGCADRVRGAAGVRAQPHALRAPAGAVGVRRAGCALAPGPRLRAHRPCLAHFYCGCMNLRMQVAQLLPPGARRSCSQWGSFAIHKLRCMHVQVWCWTE